MEINCYTLQIDRADGLPEVAVNFSGEDTQCFCKRPTFSCVLLSHGRLTKTLTPDACWAIVRQLGLGNVCFVSSG